MPSPLTSEQERLTTIFFYCIVILLGYLFFRILAPFFAPLGWAAVLAIFVYPFHERLVSRHGNAGAAGLSTLIVTVLIVGPGLVILTAFEPPSPTWIGTLLPPNSLSWNGAGIGFERSFLGHKRSTSGA